MEIKKESQEKWTGGIPAHFYDWLVYYNFLRWNIYYKCNGKML